MQSSPLVSQLGSSDPGERFAALAGLSDLAADSYGADATHLAAVLREAGGIDTLVRHMEDPAADVQQCAMSLVGNLLTDVFDPEARTSLNLFAKAGGLPVLQKKLHAEFPINLFAAAALQNVTALDPEDCCAALRELGADSDLAGLAQNDNEQVRKRAACALTLRHKSTCTRPRPQEQVRCARAHSTAAVAPP